MTDAKEMRFFLNEARVVLSSASRFDDPTPEQVLRAARDHVKARMERAVKHNGGIRLRLRPEQVEASIKALASAAWAMFQAWQAVELKGAWPPDKDNLGVAPVDIDGILAGLS